MENKIYLLTLIGNFVNMNKLPEEVLKEIYPLQERLQGENGSLETWWNEMFRRNITAQKD